MIEKKLTKYILPNVLAMVGTSCYLLADTFFISAKAGANGITALNLVLPIYGLIFAIGAMIGIGCATKYALSKAKGDKDCNKYFVNSIVFTLIISIVFIILGLTCADGILRILGADDTILNTGLDYTRIVFLFAPFFMLNFTFTAFVRNDNAPTIAMIATISSGMFNILFDYILMYPLNLGMLGAGLATGISPIVSMSICLVHYLSRKSTVKLIRCKLSIKLLASCCNLGIVAFVGEISNAVTTLAYNYILLAIVGNIAVASYGIVANVALVGVALFNGVSQGLQPLASISHGCNNVADEKRILRRSIQIALIIAVVLVGVVIAFADAIVSIFNSEQSALLQQYAVEGIRLYFVGFLFACINIVFAGFCSATGKAKLSSIIAITRGIVAIVVFAILLSQLFGIVGVWLSFAVAEAFTLVLTLILNRYYNKRQAKTE